jgi:Flp pilus assembly protein CpaB
VRAGDHVDILGGFNVVRIDSKGVPIQQGGSARPVLKLLMENILVLEVPTDAGGGLGGGSKEANVVLRLSDQQAAELAFASDNGKIWFSLRPQSGGQAAAPSFVTLETLLLGVKPITVLRSFGGQQ